MSLKDLRVPEETIQFPGGTITVRGLSFGDISGLVARHKLALSALFDQVTQGAGPGVAAFDETSAFGAALLDAAPGLAADVIATAAGEPDQVAAAMKLPALAQIEALDKIGRLTFAMEGGAKKALEIVVRMAKGTTGLLADLNR